MRGPYSDIERDERPGPSLARLVVVPGLGSSVLMLGPRCHGLHRERSPQGCYSVVQAHFLDDIHLRQLIHCPGYTSQLMGAKLGHPALRHLQD